MRGGDALAGAGVDGLRVVLARGPSVLVVVAHPDDEVVGAGGRIACLAPRVAVLHLTDGSPRKLDDARAAGFADRDAYAGARREELVRALALAGLREDALHAAGVVDQEASLHLVPLSLEVARLIRSQGPDVVLSMAYEGGHPDHDAAAFCASAAVRLVRRAEGRAPELWEFPLYRAEGDRVAKQHFLPAPSDEYEVRLSPEEAERVRRMVGCFVSQRRTLEGFGFCLEVERFRPAPTHDFARPPHPGRLFYERFDWGMTASRWCELAARATAELGLTGTECA